MLDLRSSPLRNLINCLRDYVFYKRISCFAKDEWVIISTYGIGDTYFVCAFAEQILKHHGGRSASVIVKREHADIPKLFTNVLKKSIVLGSFNWRVLNKLDRFGPGKPFIGHPHYLNRKDLYERMGLEGCTVLDLYRSIFSLPPSSPITKPVIDQTTINSAKKRFEHMKLPKGKTIILAPEANSFPTFPMEFWFQLSQALKKKGWHVCTNMANGSIPIPETRPFYFPLNEAIPVAELAGFVVSFRSGFCDLISSAKCKLVVVYPKTTYSAGTYFTSFSLRKMGLSESLDEYEPDANESRHSFISRIANGIPSVN